MKLSAAIDIARAEWMDNGFEAVSVDILQPADLFLDLVGEDIGRRMFFTAGLGTQELCLRPDFTLPIAQSIFDQVKTGAFDVAVPHALGYVGTVFRQRERGAQESQQAGVEIIGGPETLDAEARCLTFAKQTLAALKVNNTQLTVGSVMLFEAVLAQSGIDAEWQPRIRARFGHKDAMMRLLNRLKAQAPFGDSLMEYESLTPTQIRTHIDQLSQKFGLIAQNARSTDEIANRLMEKIRLNKVRINPQAIDVIKSYLEIEAPLHKAQAEVTAFCDSYNMPMEAALNQFSAQMDMIAEIEPCGTTFKAGFGRRLDYYSGLIFEYIGIKDSAQPLAGGGRYDRLLTRMGATEPISAVGSAVWLDRVPGIVPNGFRQERETL